MTKLRSFSIIFIILIISPLHISFAQNWPGWRGPDGDGTSVETNLPALWDSVTNVVWKKTVPGIGYSSPVIWNDRLFTITALPETHEKVLLCYNCNTGDLLWQRTVLKTSFEKKHNDNSFASGTPATDGKLIYVAFLDGKEVVAAAYDFTGKQVWTQRPGTYYSPHGFSCSPVLFEDKVIINGGSQVDSFLAALSRADGHVIWKVSHDNPAHSFTTPIIAKMAGKMQLIYGGNKEISSFNPGDGSRYWYVRGPSEEFCSSPVYDKKADLVIFSSSWPVRILMAIRPDGKGDVTSSHVAWQSRNGAVYVPSPIVTGDYLFTTMTTGQVHCIDVASGNILWKENLGPQYASPVFAGGLVYMPNDNGVITVIKPGTEFNYISKNSIGEKMFASPAISKGKIYIRGYRHLFCISKNGSL